MHHSNLSLMTELLKQYTPNVLYRIIPRPTSGVNNTTMIITDEVRTYVLRIYETHRDEAKVRAEHETLLALAGLPKPFRTPLPIATADGHTFTRTPDGKIAALFAYMDGTHPAFQQLDQMRSFGQTVGALTNALAAVKPAQSSDSEYRPYYEIEHTHPQCPPEKVLAFCAEPPEPFAMHHDALRQAGRAIEGILAQRAAFDKLPHQLIHGDLNASNILAGSEHGPITAVLDFEFVTRDLRAMELAVCLSDLIDPGAADSATWPALEAFSLGYGSVMRLADDEIAAVPALIALRRLDVFIHFLGRYWDGVDSAEQLHRFIAGIDTRLAWIETNRGRLRSLLQAFCGEKGQE